MKKAYKKNVPTQQPLPTSEEHPRTVTVLVDSQLQHDMVAETPLSQVDGAVTGALNKDGSSQVFYMNSSDVMCAYQSKDTAETWTVENTRIPSGSKPAAISASKDGTRLFMVDKSQALYVLDMRKRFPTWSSLGTIPNSETLLDLRTLKDANKNTIAVVISTTGNFHNAYQVDLNGTWTQDKIFSANMGGAVYDVQVSAAYGDASVSSSWGYYMSGRIGFNDPEQYGLVTLNSMATWGERRLIALGTFSSIASLPTDIPGFSYFFAIDANKHVQYFKPNGNSFTAVSIAPNITASSVVVGRRIHTHTSGLMQIPEVMILSTSGEVYHLAPATHTMSEQEVSVDSWTAPAQIASSVSNIVVEQESKQVPSYFLSTSNAQLMFVTMSASTGEWVKQQVELPPASSTPATTQEVYYLNIRVLNANAVPVSGGSASISVDGYALMQVNGRQYRVDANRPLVTSLNRIGQLSVTAICNKKISTPVFSVHVSGMDAEDVMDVNPAGSIQLKFKNSTPAFLLNATNQITGKQTIQGDYRDPAVIKTVSDALNKSGAISSALHETSIDHRKYLHPSVNAEVARVRRRTDPSMNKVNVARVTEGGFRMSFANTYDGKPHLQYETLTAEQGVALVEAWKADLSDFKAAWGDVTEGIANAWYAVKDFVINTVGGAIVASIRLVVDTVEMLWEGAVHFVNQVLDLAQMVFDKIKVFFEDIFAWLAFFFDWDDIKATQKVLKDKLVGFTDTMNSLVNTWLPEITASAVDIVRQFILQSFSQLESTLGGTTWSSWDHEKKTRHGMLGDNDGISLDHLPSSAWWFIEKALSGFTGGFGGFDFGSTIDAVIASFEAVKNSITSQTTRKDWQNFMDSLSNLGTTLTSKAVLDKSTIISFLQVLKSGILLLLDGVVSLVAGFTSLVRSLVSYWSKVILAPLNIPILSPIYKAITGDDLSTINFCTMLFAIPITLGYKLLYNVAPFPASARSKALAAKVQATEFQDVLFRCAAVVKFIAMFLDTSVDVERLVAKEAPLWIQVLNNLVTPAISSALTFNYRQKFGKVTLVQKLSLAAWGASLVPILLNFGVMAYTKGKQDMTSTPTHAGILAAVGVGMTGVGIAFTICQIVKDKYEWQSSADTICDPLPLCFKWLVFAKSEETAMLLLLVDACTSLVVVLARWASV